MDHRKQQGSSPRSGGSASSGKHGKGGKGGGAGGKKPIKVVYISNPMRVKTSAEGFRALVQELTGRHADPSKYSTNSFDDDHGAAQELSPEGSAAPSTPDAAAGHGHAGSAAVRGQPDVGAAAFGSGEDDDGDEEDDIFRSQLLDNDYSMFSSTTLLYDYPHSNKV